MTVSEQVLPSSTPATTLDHLLSRLIRRADDHVKVPAAVHANAVVERIPFRLILLIKNSMDNQSPITATSVMTTAVTHLCRERGSCLGCNERDMLARASMPFIAPPASMQAVRLLTHLLP